MTGARGRARAAAMPARGKAAMPARHDSLLVTHLPNVHYLTGFTGSSGCVLITPRRRYFFTDFRYRDQARREVRDFDVRITAGSSLDGCCRYITARNLKTGKIGIDGAHLTLLQFKLIKRLLKGMAFTEAAGAVEKMRQVKTRAEIAKLRQACEIADAAYGKLVRSRVIGKTEKEIAWRLESAMRDGGSGPTPFEIIVASGPRSAMPHGVASERVIGKGELVVIDMGASVGGYCSDVTRTFATGPLPAKLREIYLIVQEARQRAFDGTLAGAAASGVDALAREHIEAAGYGAAFGHSLGHGVGLEGHEGPVLSRGSKDVLAAGMAVTVEPGIYLEGKGGVRIEDTVLVTDRGPEALTKFPRELTRLS
ncbi:MAG: Xaa-Pro peptidase family protein [Actinobacteria bacterium]|nr:Xaa-Pro peptidase family protein [Actinomycetota bacterium]